jgi:hypothetical protein
LIIVQPENCENRNNPDLVQAFLKKWWVESDFKAPNLPLSLRLKVSGMKKKFINNDGQQFHQYKKKRIIISHLKPLNINKDHAM